MILDSYNLNIQQQRISYNTEIRDKEGKLRSFAKIDTVKKTGIEQIFPDKNNHKNSYEIEWDENNPFPYDIFIFGIKNPTDQEILELLNDKT